MIKKRIIGCIMTITIMVMMSGCGKTKEVNLEGSCQEILHTVYENAAFDDDQRQAMEYYAEETLSDAEVALNVLGTNEVAFTDSVYSAPMMTSVAYECVLLRLEDGQDVSKAKEILEKSADPRKWICVEAESTVVENVGNVVLIVMADQDVADAIKTSFLALGE